MKIKAYITGKIKLGINTDNHIIIYSLPNRGSLLSRQVNWFNCILAFK